MAKFCMKCFNKLHGTDYTEQQVTLSDGLCEGCGKIQPCVILLRPPSLTSRIIKAVQTKRQAKPVAVKRKGHRYIITVTKNQYSIDNKPLTVQDAYIHLFGAIGVALDELSEIALSPDCHPKIVSTFHVLQQAIGETEEYIELANE